VIIKLYIIIENFLNWFKSI